jgi:hypothetical protein
LAKDIVKEKFEDVKIDEDFDIDFVDIVCFFKSLFGNRVNESLFNFVSLTSFIWSLLINC